MSASSRLGTCGGTLSRPPAVDLASPHYARVHDWCIGGKDHFPADRELGAELLSAVPGLRGMARASRAFLERVVRHLAADHGVRQFLDIGTGIPTHPSVHEVAQEVTADPRVVYVDNDRVVLAHARALLRSSRARTATVAGDLRDPGGILADRRFVDTLDLTEPVGLLLGSVLMLVADTEDPWTSTAKLLHALPSGSYVAISHLGRDFAPASMDALARSAAAAGVPVAPRTREAVTRFFDDWDVLPPGVVPVDEWGRPTPSSPAYYWAGVARKP